MMASVDLLALCEENPDQVWDSIDAKATLVEGIKKVIEHIAKSKDDFEGWFEIKGDKARVSLRIDDKILPVGGNEYNVIAANKLAVFFNTALSNSSGDFFDNDILKLLNPPVKVALFFDDKKPAGKRPAWSPERRARQAASIAARNAKKMP